MPALTIPSPERTLELAKRIRLACGDEIPGFGSDALPELESEMMELGAKAVRVQRNRVVRFGCRRRGLGLRRDFRDGAQGIDHLRALGVVLQQFEIMVGFEQ